MPKNKAKKVDLRTHGSKKNPELFFNRELSWLQFNYRVLQQTTIKEKPLLERLKFLSIFEENLIEFFMVRVAGLKQMKASSYSELQLDGRSSAETLQEISRVIRIHLQELFGFFDDISQELSSAGIQLLRSHIELSPTEKKFVHSYFQAELFRVLTPFAVDRNHSFPRISNARMNLVVVLECEIAKGNNKETYAFIEVPHLFPRFVELPSHRRQPKLLRFIALEECIKMCLHELFVGNKVKSVSEFTIVRNSELSIDAVASDDLLSAVEDELKNRPWGEVVSLHHSQNLPKKVMQFLLQGLNLEEYETYERRTFLNMQNLRWLYDRLSSKHSRMCDKTFLPRNVSFLKKGYSQDVFHTLKQKELLFHHPYDSFQGIEDLLAIVAEDPQVLAIKQTLYRIGKDSPFVTSLIKAAENGKQVTVLVELKARFDEERNINWARELENHGVHVVYGLVGLKIHGKVLQIVRREQGGTCSYVHLSTGNYNPDTAKYYTDIGVMTANFAINHDVTNLFHSLTGVFVVPRFKKISTAPINLRYTLLRLIQKEIANAQKKKKTKICLKMNALVDPEMIIALYRASQSGVKIELNIRGICCLRPNIPGLSENIKVVSIVGCFLEHARIFYFENDGGVPKVFLSSADWMPRNLNRRVEILFPVEGMENIKRLISILDISFQDTYNLSELRSDGSYECLRTKAKGTHFDSQLYFCKQANKAQVKEAKDKQSFRNTGFQPSPNPVGENE